ncbi:MAG: hypothetical protein KGI38_02850 [Thaumarchaeota archaeon]|nr:hypothetical protein [Nitrososphaerota archaeon]
MRVATRIEYPRLAAGVQDTLEELGMTYLTNHGKAVTEFEVQSPCHFRILVEEHTEESFGFPFVNRGGSETALELHKDLATPESDPVLRQHASAFVRGLVAALPDPPWKGFGIFRGRSEKNRWKDLEAFPGPQD